MTSRTMRGALLALLTAPAIAAGQFLPTATAERCAAVTGVGTAGEWIEKAIARVTPSTANRILRYRESQDSPYWDQSDRPYAPFIPNIVTSNRWYDPATTVEGRHPYERALKPGDYPSQIYTAAGMFLGRDSAVRSVSTGTIQLRANRDRNPWAVLASWKASAPNARVVQRCIYRDEPRIVLELGGERLYLSQSDATPIKLERMESNFLWGQLKAQYLWSTWWRVRGSDALFPLATFRLLDGELYEKANIWQGSVALIPADSAPRLTIPANIPEAAPLPVPGQILVPDTVRVGDATWLLVTPQYTETVTLQRDTVFLLDATTSEARARGDSAVIASLFPGKHPVVVVVTDLAWLHVGGVRFWVARGATIVSHRTSEDFLRRVVNRKWTGDRDALERSRATARFRFRPVDDSLRLAGGALVVHALQGSSTETALGVWMPGLRYFWAGDYIQNSPDSPYAYDVVQTIRNLKLVPLKVGAQHIKLTDWVALESR